MKKRIIIISLAVVLVLLCTFSFSGCSTDDAANTTTPIAQLQTDVTTLKSDVAGLKTAVAGISVPANLSTTLTGLQTTANTLNTSITALQSSASTLQSQVTILNNKVAELESGGNVDLTAINAEIAAINVQLEDITEYLVYLTDMNIVNRLITLEAALQNLGTKVDITRFSVGSAYMEFKTLVAGDYTVIVTLFGTDLNALTVSIPTGNNVAILADNIYGAGNGTMRVLVLEPKDAGTPPVDVNWTANKVVEIDYVGSGTVNYAEIATGTR